ncbi:2'-5' RNA ligase family protein [Nocardioides sp.]|uniref:2'-5' RNA ligase family protein n=1 Tax=Nocardioides sp. TaxID=35761 RepID=UPI003D0C1C53
MPREGTTALLLPVPPADPILAAVAAQYPRTVRAGVPAHLTALYPFLDHEQLSETTLDGCTRIAAELAPFSVEFSRCATEPGMICLVPEPDENARRVIQLCEDEWPSVRPYGGKYASNSPHVSVALDPEPDHVPRILGIVEPLLPIRCEFSELHLVAYRAGAWGLCRRWSFGLSAA